MTPFQDSSMPAFIPMSSSTGGDPRLSPFKGFARSYSADPNIPLPAYLRQYHKDAYNHISKALSIDEEGGKGVVRFFWCVLNDCGDAVLMGNPTSCSLRLI